MAGGLAVGSGHEKAGNLTEPGAVDRSPVGRAVHLSTCPSRSSGIRFFRRRITPWVFVSPTERGQLFAPAISNAPCFCPSRSRRLFVQSRRDRRTPHRQHSDDPSWSSSRSSCPPHRYFDFVFVIRSVFLADQLFPDLLWSIVRCPESPHE